MPRCEDFPCCGHAAGDCPDAQGRMRCVECGRKLRRNASSSICESCTRKIMNAGGFDDERW